MLGIAVNIGNGKTNTAWRRFAIVLAVLTAVACAAKPKPKSVATDDALPLAEAMQAIGTNLVAQTLKEPTGVAAQVGQVLRREPPPVNIVIDPFIDAQNGYAVGVGRAMQDAIAARVQGLAKHYAFQPLTAPAFNQSTYVMTGAVSFQDRGQGQPGRAYRVSVALTDTKSGIVAAQSSAWLREQMLDMKPLPIYQDSPVFLTDRYTKGLVDTSTKTPGQPADRTYHAQLSTSALIAEAQQAFTAEDATNSLALYQRAESRPDGKTLKVYSGLYVNHLRAGNLNDAERIFGQLIGVAFAENNLSIRILYRVNSTDFITEPRLNQQYRFWVRTLAQHITRNRACVDVQGHSSRSGSEEYNRTLSLRRAEALRQQMEQESRGVLALSRATGRGVQDNLIGSGSDDERDAIDRRVEFKIIDCTIAKS